MIKADERVIQRLHALGWPARLVPFQHVSEVRETIDALHAQGQLDETFYQERLQHFRYDPPVELPSPRSVFIVAVPAPQTVAYFHWEGIRHRVVLPPTYVNYGSTNDRVASVVAEYVREEGFTAWKAVLPLKTIAVRAGLAKYGRNNITYVSGMGSFVQLVGCMTDLPSTNDTWSEPTMLDRCQECTACLRNCPTSAIAEDRFLLHAERCLAFCNERRGEFPAWLDPSWHNSLLGCMQCQRYCPEDKSHLSLVEERGEFLETETALLLQGIPLEQLPQVTREKLGELDLEEDMANIPRNLSALINAERSNPRREQAKSKDVAAGGKGIA